MWNLLLIYFLVKATSIYSTYMNNTLSFIKRSTAAMFPNTKFITMKKKAPTLQKENMKKLLL